MNDERGDRVRMVDESAQAALRGDVARARGVRFTRPGFDRGRWDAFAQLGWLALRVEEEQGGLGFGLTELCAIARQMGRVLTPEPVLNAAVIAPALPSAERQAVMRGELIILPAFASYGASRGGDRAFDPVPFADGAVAFVVIAEREARLVDRSDLAEYRTVETHDGGHSAILKSGQAGQALDGDLSALRDEAALVLSAYLLGVAEAAFELATDYLKTREQFGRPIGAFQALQHKAVDLYLELALLRAAVGAAVDTFDDGAGQDERERKASLAKARASQAANLITQSAIQLHGGIGYTDEADVGLYARKVMTLAGLLGTERFHRDRAFRLSGLLS